MSDDQKDEMATCKHFLFMIPPDRLAAASAALAAVFAETGPVALAAHLDAMKRDRPRSYRGLQLNDQD